MPRIAYDDVSILETVRRPTKGFEERAELRSMIEQMPEGKIIRLSPDEGESMRKLKRMVTTAAGEVGRPVKQTETEEGDLLVFIPEPKAEGAPRRGRRPQTIEEG